MKKQKVGRVVGRIFEKRVMVLIMVLFALVLSLTAAGCDKTPDSKFEKVRHTPYEYYYYNIDVYSQKLGNIEFCIEDTLYNVDTKRAQDLAEKVKSDYDMLDAAFGLETEVQVYLVIKGTLPKYGFGHDGRVYVKLDSLNNQRYLLPLTMAYLSTYDSWKMIGAHNYIFGELSEGGENDGIGGWYGDWYHDWIGESDDDHKAFLTDYYSVEENLPALSLFEAYFSSAFADNETIAAAEKTAFGLSEYLIENKGLEYFLAAGLTDGRQEWLDWLGIEKEFSLPFSTEWLKGAFYPVYSSSYPLGISIENRTYYLSPIRLEDYDESSRNSIGEAFSTPYEVLSQLSQGVADVERCMEYIKQNAPAAYPHVLERYNSHIEYYIQKGEGGSFANSYTNKISLSWLGHFVHETVHILTLTSSNSDKWLGEGIAEYFSSFSGNNSVLKKAEYYGFTVESKNEKLQAFKELCAEYYAGKGKSFATIEEFDLTLAYEAYAAVSLSRPDLASAAGVKVSKSVGEIYKDVWGQDLMRFEGNELTYLQSFLFVKYLIENVSLDKILLYSLRVESLDFESELGATLGEVLAEFRAQYTAESIQDAA